MDNIEGVGFILPHWFYWGWLLVMPTLFLLWAKTSKVMPEVPYREGAGAVEKGLDWLSDRSGWFVSLWSVNAVAAYTYEVVARYIFDTPTIWVHESSYLLFGMQYMMAGAYGLLHGSHVRVDVLYSKFSPVTQAGIDVFTSIFFFIFVVAMVYTSYTFFFDSVAIDERSLETWQVHFWPVKGAMLLGAVLILLAGISRFIKDVKIFEARLRGEAA